MRRTLIAVWLLSILGASLCAARDAEFTVDFFCGWDGHYRPMEWTPIELGVSSDLEEPFAGSVVLSARQDGLNTLHVAHPFVLTPAVPATLPLVTKFAFGAQQCDITLRDERGRARFDQTVNFWDYSAANRILHAVKEQDLLIGLVGQSQFGILRLPQETRSVSATEDGKVFVGAKVARMVPWDWTGFVSLDLLILYDPDWSLLREEQAEAIRQWVHNGGTVLLVLGRNPLPPTGPIRAMLPFQASDLREIELSPKTLDRLGLKGDEPERVTAWPLRLDPGAVVIGDLRAGEAQTIFSVAHSGFGRVGVLAFPPSDLSDRQDERTAEFWTRLIAAGLGQRADSANAERWPGGRLMGPTSRHGRTIEVVGQDARPSGRHDNRFLITAAQSGSNQVLEHLYQIRQMRPLSIWWVILPLAALAVLLGPVDYLVLKRIDKLPYTWLTSTGWIVLFTVGAYYGVQWVRGGDMEVRAVSVLDGIAGREGARAVSYMGVFAPRSDEYQLSGLRRNQWWSGLAPSQHTISMHHRQAAMRQIHCVQTDGGNLPFSLPINIWTVQSLVGEWPVDALPFTAQVDRQRNELTVEIENDSDSPIRTGYVLFEDAYASFDAVPAHATQRFDLKTLPFSLEDSFGPLPWQQHGGHRHAGPQIELPQYPTSLAGRADAAFFAEGTLSRTLAMHEYLKSGAALVCVAFEGAPLPFEFEGRSYTANHVQLARQLIPDVRAAGEGM